MLRFTHQSLLQNAFKLSLGFSLAFSLTTLSVATEMDESTLEQVPQQTVLTQHQDFDRTDLFSPEYRGANTVSGFSFLNPSRFSMQQSYSVNFASGSLGASSAGLYLNTLSYKLADPLTLSADIGFYSPLYSSAPGNFNSNGIQDPSRGSSLVFPRIGLEYKPTKNTSFSLHLFNGQDAQKAYGLSDSFMNPWAH